MAVMLIATAPGTTREQQQPIYDTVGDQLREQDGFLFHAAGPTDEGWRLFEAWESREQLDTWVQETILPNLPEQAPEPQMDVVPIEVVIKP